MRISKERLSWLAVSKNAKIDFWLEYTDINYKGKIHEFTGSDKNKKAFDFLNKLK